MAVPSINQTFDRLDYLNGVAVSQTFTATNTPTSWAMTNVPTGLSFNTSTGALTGTPIATRALAFSSSITATNGDGTSNALLVLIVVDVAAAGGTTGDFADEIDFVLTRKELVTLGGPVETPPNEVDPPGPLLTKFWTGERYELAVGLSKNGILQDATVDELDGITVSLLDRQGARPVVISEEGITEIGSGAGDRRYKVTVGLTAAQFARHFREGVRSTGAATYFDAVMQLAFSEITDARQYDSGLLSTSIPSLTQSDSEVDSFDLNLTDQLTSATYYQLVLNLVCPSDTGLNVTLTRQLSVTWNGSAYVVTVLSGASSGTGSSTVSGDWDTTLANSSLTGDGTGLVCGTTVTTTAQAATMAYVEYDSLGYAEITPEVLEWDGNGSGVSYIFSDDVPEAIYTLEMADGDTAASVTARLVTNLGAGASCEFTSLSSIRFEFPISAGVAQVEDVNATDTIETPTNIPGGPTYTDATVTARLTGVTMDNRELRRTAAGLVRVYQGY